MSENQVEITTDDVESFAEKLRALAESLTPGEQAVFQQIVRPPHGATVGGAEVEGYGLNVGVFNPFNLDHGPYWIIGNGDSPTHSVYWHVGAQGGGYEVIARDHRS